MSRYLMDTNHVSGLWRGEERLAERIRSFDGVVYLCTPVVGELWHMVYSSQRQAENIVELEILLSLFPVLAYDDLAAREYGRIRSLTKQQGFTLPPVDAMIAATALVHGLTVLTSDSDFLLIPDLQGENWLM
jgi:tRNA(fMet)-specific endonuclease VapC